MKNRFSWLDKPVTWRGYIKLSGICSIIGLIYGTVYVFVAIPEWWETVKASAIAIFSLLKPKKKVFQEEEVES